MKKTRILILLGLIMSLLIGCSKDNYEIVKMEAERSIYYFIDDLEAATDIIVIGEFIEEDTQKAKYQYETDDVHMFLTHIYSTNVIEIKKVLKGKVESDTIKVSQSYGIEEDTGRLITFSELTPMKKGESWIFFLRYNEENETYWCVGDYSGRYPLPNEELLELCNKVKEIKKPLNKILTEEKELSRSQTEMIIESYEEDQRGKGSSENSPDYLYESSDRSIYRISDDGDKKEIANVYSKIDECRAEIMPETFGVFDQNKINLELYCDILEKYEFLD